MNESNTIHCELAVRNAHILTLDQDFTEFAPGLILVNQGKLVYVGPDAPFAPPYHALQTLDARGMLAMPPFFNSHHHAGMSIYRGLGNDLTLKDWLNHFVWPMEARFTNADNVYLGTMLSNIEMVKSGTGLFVDMYFFAEEVARASKDIGIRAMIGEAILDFPTPHFKDADSCYGYVGTLCDRFARDPLIGVTVPAHAPYSCSENVLRKVATIAAEHQVPATIHLAETKHEVDDFMARLGKTSTKYLDELGFFDHHAVAYHCIWLNDEDKNILKEKNVGVATITHSNLKLASGVCPVNDLLKRGIRVAIGTDGAASNNNLNMIQDMRTTALVHKVIENDPTVLDAHTSLRMATLYGAMAYRIDHLHGSLEAGKAADLILVNNDQAHWQPMHDPYASIVYAMQPADVDTSVINGQIVMQNRQLTLVEEEKYYRQARDLLKKMRV